MEQALIFIQIFLFLQYMVRDDYKQKQKIGSCDTQENEGMKKQKCSLLHVLVKMDLTKILSCWWSLESEKTHGSS